MAALLLGGCQTTTITEGPTASPSSGASGVAAPGPGGPVASPQVVAARLSDRGRGFTINVRYPQIKYPSNAQVEAAINSAIKKDIEEQVGKLRTSLTDAAAEMVGSENAPPSTLDADFETVLVDNRIAAFRENYSFYFSGAAHPGGSITTQNFDLTTGNRYELANLFKPGVNYLETLSQFCRQMVRDKISALDNGQPLDEPATKWIDDGTQPSPDNFAAWSLGPNGLEITFQLYQVGPYALGPVKCEVPQSALADSAADLSPLKQA
jgi:hypothetical protein